MHVQKRHFVNGHLHRKKLLVGGYEGIVGEAAIFTMRIMDRNAVVCYPSLLGFLGLHSLIVSNVRHESNITSMRIMVNTYSGCTVMTFGEPNFDLAATSDPNVRSTRSRILFDMDLSRLTRVLIHLILIILSLIQRMIRLKSFNLIIALVAFPSAKSRIRQVLERSHVISRTSHLLPMQDVFLVQWKKFLANQE